MDYDDLDKLNEANKRIAQLEAELAKEREKSAQLNDALVKFVNAVNIIGNAVAICPRVQLELR